MEMHLRSIEFGVEFLQFEKGGSRKSKEKLPFEQRFEREGRR